MRKVPLGYSLLTYLDELQFTEAALAAEPDAADLAPVFQAEIQDWEAIFTKERAGRRAVVRADAILAVKDATLDLTTQKFAGVLLVDVNQDRKSIGFRKYFKSAPSELIRSNIRKQCEHTRDVILAELNKVGADSPLKPFAGLFETVVNGTLSALDARAKAHGDRATSSHDVVVWKEGINKLRTTIYAELLKRAADNGYPRTWPDTFFRRPATREEPEAEPAPETPAG